MLLGAGRPVRSNYSAEEERVLWTLIGVGIAVLVMFIGDRLAKRSAKAPPQAASQAA